MKKYYWLKLSRDFFKRHDIRIIKAMPNGAEYVMLYLNLLTESIDHDGRLRFSDSIPYTTKMLATIMDTDEDTMQGALDLFRELEMVEILEDGTIFTKECTSLIGSASAEDKKEQARVRQQRKREKDDESNTSVQDVTQCHADVTQDVTQCHANMSREKEIEKEIEIEIDKKTKAKKREAYFDDDALNAAFEEFIKMRKQMRAPLTEKAIALAVEKITKLASENGSFNPNTAIDIINQSVLNGWKSFYAPKEAKNTEPAKAKKNSFANFEQRKYSDDFLEALSISG